MLDSESAQAALARLGLSARRVGKMQELLDRLRRLSRGDQPVWISGELGAGRHSAALALHALSGRQAGPVLVLHGRELQPVLRLLEQPDADSATEARRWLLSCDEVVADGTLVIDEGGTMDLAVRGLFQDLLAMSLRTRLVLLTAEGAVPAALYQEADLLAHLRPRHVRVPPLARRKDEIYALCQEALREQAGLDLNEDAAPLLAGRRVARELVAAPPSDGSSRTGLRRTSHRRRRAWARSCPISGPALGIWGNAHRRGHAGGSGAAREHPGRGDADDHDAGRARADDCCYA